MLLTPGEVNEIVPTRWPRTLLAGPASLFEARVESPSSTFRNAPKTLHVEMDEFTWMVSLVANDGTRCAVEACEH